MSRALRLVGAVLIVTAVVGCAPTDRGSSPLLPLSQRYAIQEEWIAARHDRLLEQMRRHDVGMWLVVTEEFHPDPLVQVVVSPRPLAGNRDVFAFVDGGEQGLIRVAAVRYYEENLARFFVCPEEPRKAEEVLGELVRDYRPSRIAVSVGGKRGPARSLGYDAHDFLVEALGPEAAARMVPAAALIEDVLDTRLEEERPHYETLVALTDELARRAFSNEVIDPGSTTVGEVRNWLFDRVGELGLECWFQPDLRVQRRGEAASTSRGFLAVASEDTVIQPGDLLHVDFGMVYMGLSSDWQRMAYVLRPGEHDAPEGLRRALANTNAVQEAFATAARPGKTGGEVYAEVMAEMEERGIRAQIYSHALGVHGHGVGPTIDFRAAERADLRSATPLRPGSYLAVELNTSLEVPEWDGKKVFAMQEDPALLSDAGYVFFRPRQKGYYLIEP